MQLEFSPSQAGIICIVEQRSLKAAVVNVVHRLWIMDEGVKERWCGSGAVHAWCAPSSRDRFGFTHMHMDAHFKLLIYKQLQTRLFLHTSRILVCRDNPKAIKISTVNPESCPTFCDMNLKTLSVGLLQLSATWHVYTNIEMNAVISQAFFTCRLRWRTHTTHCHRLE